MNPWWLLLLAPPIIHWLNRGSGKPYPMGDLRFFDRQSPRQLRFYRPRRLLLLLIRLMLVAIGVLILLRALDPGREGSFASASASFSSARTDSSAPQIATLAEFYERGASSRLVLADDATLATSLLPADFDPSAVDIVPPSDSAPALRIGVAVGDSDSLSEITQLLNDLETVGQRRIEIACQEHPCREAVDVWFVDDNARFSEGAWQIQWDNNSGEPLADSIFVAAPRTFALSEPSAASLDRILRWIPVGKPTNGPALSFSDSLNLLGLLFAMLVLAERWLSLRDEARGN